MGLAFLGAGACALAQEVDARAALGRFFWPYAAMAADVYSTRGSSQTNIAIALASPWLRQEVAGSGEGKGVGELQKLNYEQAEVLYQQALFRRCEQAKSESHDAPVDTLPACAIHGRAVQLQNTLSQEQKQEPIQFAPGDPQQESDCDYVGHGKEPFVPVPRISQGERPWVRVPELQKYAPAGSWRLFVPDLAIDVWRRQRSAYGAPLVIEYAIVFRGTVGGGGWVSNLRAVMSIAPFFVWDQYRQAREGTLAIVEQVQRIHVIRDSLLNAPPTQLLFTTVGHSLGGGLAEDVYLHTPQITKVVAFDASPANGARGLAIQERGAVMSNVLRTVDRDRPGSNAAIHLIYESGSILSDVAQCNSGALWGDEGGPLVQCDRVNLSRGTPFRQHNMAQFACKLFLLARGGNAAAPKVQP